LGTGSGCKHRVRRHPGSGSSSGLPPPHQGDMSHAGAFGILASKESRLHACQRASQSPGQQWVGGSHTRSVKAVNDPEAGLHVRLVLRIAAKGGHDRALRVDGHLHPGRSRHGVTGAAHSGNTCAGEQRGHCRSVGSVATAQLGATNGERACARCVAYLSRVIRHKGPLRICDLFRHAIAVGPSGQRAAAEREQPRPGGAGDGGRISNPKAPAEAAIPVARLRQLTGPRGCPPKVDGNRSWKWKKWTIGRLRPAQGRVGLDSSLRGGGQAHGGGGCRQLRQLITAPCRRLATACNSDIQACGGARRPAHAPVSARAP